MAILLDRASTDVESAAQELVQPARDLVQPARDQQAALDAALEVHALTGRELDSKLHVIEWLREQVVNRWAAYRRSLEEGRRRGRAALLRAWDALIDGLNAVVGSLIAAVVEGGLGIASRLQSAEEVKDLWRALYKGLR